MKFGKTLIRTQIQEWSRQYISYKALKHDIKAIQQALDDQDVGASTERSSQGGANAVEALTMAFMTHLDRNLEKVSGFYTYKRTELERRLSVFQEKAKRLASEEFKPHAENLNSFAMALAETKDVLHHLIRYADANQQGFHKILKKYDKKLNRSIRDECVRHKVDVQPFANVTRLNEMLDALEDISFQVQRGLSTESLDSLNTPPAEHMRTNVEGAKEANNRAVDFALEKDNVRDLHAALITMLGVDVTDDDATPNHYLTCPGHPKRSWLTTRVLPQAVFCRATNCIAYLFRSGANINEKDKLNERTLFHTLVLGGGRLSQRGNAPFKSHLLNAKAKDMDKLFSSDAADSLLEAKQEALADDTELLQFLFEHAPEPCQGIIEPDIFGRRPLHYAAIMGAERIAVLLDDYQQKEFPNENERRWTDVDGYTPLYHATVRGHAGLVAILLKTFMGNVDEIFAPVPTSESQATMSALHDYISHSHTPLAISCKFGFTRCTKLLLEKGANPNVVDDEGETPAHLCVHSGQSDCLQILLSSGRIDLEKRESFLGLTPLGLAAVEGQTECVKLLVAHGADVMAADRNGMLPHDHAVFRGHNAPATFLYQVMQTNVKPSPSLAPIGLDPHIKQKREAHIAKSYGHRYLSSDSMLIISMGTNDARKNLAPVMIADRSSMVTHPAVSMSVTAVHAVGEAAFFDLPARETIEPIKFKTKTFDDVVLRFDLQPTYGTKKHVIGRATVLMQGRPLNGHIVVPILGTGASQWEVLGTVHFDYRLVKPFHHPKAIVESRHTYWKAVETVVIGHRGAGANKSAGKGENQALQVGENTVLSLVTAASLGAEYVEFDVQLTKDKVPVIYHDWDFSESGLSIPVSSVRLAEFKQLGLQYQNTLPKAVLPETATLSPPRANAPLEPSVVSSTSSSTTSSALASPVLASVDGQKKSSRRMQRSQSFSGLRSATSRGQPKTTGSYVGGRGDTAIKGDFATLKETLQKVPIGTGFNIEVKYPSLDEMEQFQLLPHELNEFVDTILQVVYDHAGDRNIIFSSFHPDVCASLNLKQPNYPVFLLTEGGTVVTSDTRCNSLQEAMRFANSTSLLGIVTECTPLIEAPRLIRTLKENGLLLFSYGHLNNNLDHVRLQRTHGVDAVIVDRVHYIYQGQKKESSQTNSPNLGPALSQPVSTVGSPATSAVASAALTLDPLS